MSASERSHALQRAQQDADNARVRIGHLIKPETYALLAIANALIAIADGLETLIERLP